jgi:5-methylcytosine-specific restriction endonuclease McrA
MDLNAPSRMSDRELLAETRRVVDADRRTTAELVALLAEIDARKLYLGEGHSSLFTYCTHVLRLSEAATYSRIAAARAVRRCPTILARLANGDVTLTTIILLASQLTDDNHEALLDAARHKSRREVEKLVAALDPRPDVATSIRRQPSPSQAPAARFQDPFPLEPSTTTGASAPPLVQRAPKPAVVAALSPSRYLVRVTIGQETHDKLQRARNLLRHTIPNGDQAAIIDRALTVLLDQLEKTKHSATVRPRVGPAKASVGRHVPAAVKRAVWARDDGRCAFIGHEGRCPETGFLEFHHVMPFAVGGATSVENLQLRCRSHNAYEADRYFGEECDSVRTEFVLR